MILQSKPKDHLQDDWAEGVTPEESPTTGEACPMCGKTFEVLINDLCENCQIEYEQFLDEMDRRPR